MNWITLIYQNLKEYRVYIPIYLVFSAAMIWNLNIVFRSPKLVWDQALWVYAAPIFLSTCWIVIYLTLVSVYCICASWVQNILKYLTHFVTSFLLYTTTSAIVIYTAMLHAEYWLNGIVFKRFWVLLAFLLSSSVLLFITLYRQPRSTVVSPTQQQTYRLFAILYTLLSIGALYWVEYRTFNALPLFRWGSLIGMLLLAFLSSLIMFQKWCVDTQITDGHLSTWIHQLFHKNLHRHFLTVILLQLMWVIVLVQTPVSFPTRNILKHVSPISYLWASYFMSADIHQPITQNTQVASCHPQGEYTVPRPLTRTEKNSILKAWHTGFTSEKSAHQSTKKRKIPKYHVRPDIILMSTDALRADFTSLMSPLHKKTTPRLAHYQKYATIFTQAYSPASSTRQTFQALFTGAHPSMIDTQSVKRWAMSLNEIQPTLAQKISATGYRSIAIVSAKGTFTSNANALKGFTEVDLSTAHAWKKYHYAAQTHVDRIISHLSNPSDQPAFIWTHLLDTHQKYSVGPEMKRFHTHQPRYRSAIHHVDRALGRLLDFARSPERRRRTIIIFTSDHGQLLGERKFPKHQHGFSTLSAETHVPLVIWGPHIRGQKIHTPVSLLDLYPTLLTWVGLRAEDYKEACGRSLQSAIFKGTLAPKPFMLEQIPDASKQAFGVSWVENGYKLNGLPLQKEWWIESLNKSPNNQQKDLIKPLTLQELKQHLKQYLEKIKQNPASYDL